MSLKYTIGDLVWATLRGQCPWPGRVSDPPTDLDPPKDVSDYHCIYFFGLKKYKWVREWYLKPYEKYQEDMMRYCTTDGFIEALNQIVEYMENPEKFAEFSHEVDIKDELDLRSKIKFEEELDIPEIKTEEEVDIPMEVGDDQKVSDDNNDYEPMDTSVVEQKVDENVECSKLARVLLQRVTIYECEVCAVCFLKREDFKQHKQTHVEKVQDEENTIQTRNDDDNFNNNSNICDKNDSEKRTITFTILDNEIKLKFKNGQPEVPAMLNPVVALDRIDASKCKLCDQCFLDPHEYRIHEMTHLNKERFKVKADKRSEKNKPHKCSKCDARFVLKSTLEVHSIIHEPFEFVCHCGIGYYRFGEYRGHRKVVHNETVWKKKDTSKVEEVKKAKDKSDSDAEKLESEYDVDDTTVSTNKRYLNGATKEDNFIIKTKLGQVPRLKATLPGKGNKNKKKKKSHRKRSNVKYTPKQTYSCEICKKIFKAKIYVQIHQVVHTKEKRYPCDICEKRFTQPGPLKLHLKRHAGIRDFGCQYCPKVFYDKGSRDLHERTHTGTKPYQCEKCKKKFSDPSSYLRHVRTHTGEKRYECDICFKRYTESGPLQRHKITVHDKSRAIKCKMCSKTFCFAFEYRKHVKTEHAEENSD